MSNDRSENEGLRCILLNDRIKNWQRNQHCRMIANKNNDQCPALGVIKRFIEGGCGPVYEKNRLILKMMLSLLTSH